MSIDTVEIRYFQFTLLAESTVSKFHSDTEQVVVTKLTDPLRKLKKMLNIFSKVRKNV